MTMSSGQHKINHPACRDCKYLVKGYVTTTYPFKQDVCSLKPKKHGTYYAAYYWQAACEKFSPKEGDQE